MIVSKPVAVWARGSGQGLDEDEYDRFEDQLRARLGEQTIHFYQLGAQPVAGYQYPAVGVGVHNWDTITNSLGGWFSSGQSYEYGESVRQGIEELAMYVKLRRLTCPDALFVLGGYSQGAQVVGQSYIEKLNVSEKASVVFSMLFGDPKLYLPEGLGGSEPAPACRNGWVSKWRREVPDCGTHYGSLGARIPYLPDLWDDTTGLWCADDDFVCGSAAAPWTVSGHFTYGEPGGAIDQGAREAAQRLSPKLADLYLDTSRISLKAGPRGLDVVFLIDSTGSMQSMINQARGIASQLAQRVIELNGRVGLAEYRDKGDAFTARVLTPLSTSRTAFQNGLNGIRTDGGGDTPEALLHALKTVMEGQDWTDGATKAVVVLTDAGFHIPDEADGTTLSDVRLLSLSIDPVNVYPVVPSGLQDDYAELADSTTGQVVINNGDAAEALEEALTRVLDRPVARLPLNAYFADSGQAVLFDGSESYSPASEIVRWDWDFDGDGVYELTDGGATSSHVYSGYFDGLMQLRVTDANGLVASISAPVRIDAPPAEPVPAAAEELFVRMDGSTAVVTWTAPKDPGLAWQVTVDGFPVGYVAPDGRTVTLTDLESDRPVAIGIAPIDRVTGLGQQTTVEIGSQEPSATIAPSEAIPSGTEESAESSAPAESPRTGPSVTLSRASVAPGGELTVTGNGFPAGQDLEIWLHSEPALLAASSVSPDGAFAVEVIIPADTQPGKHSVVAVAADATASTDLSVEDGKGSASLPVTGPAMSLWGATAAVALILSGTVFVSARRRATGQKQA
ncbi:MAG: cutinase family protein [Bifidobacteriaceae bacterium]|jgi:hypothetical protein|nr:cutinase family protein [Bifidobacteriaceae bacterium]